MSYYRQSCSPYDVQSAQGGAFTFATVKERYENTIPIRGKRKADNIRPIKRRDRSYERIVKVSDTEYYITFDGYKWRTQHNKAITWSLNEGMEFRTIHTPRKSWDSKDPSQIYPRYLSSASVFWFYDFNMPSGFNMVNYYVNKYVKYQDKHYTLEQGDIIFQRKEGATEWQPLVVHRQFKHHIDKEKTKQLRQDIKPFLEYYDTMSGIVEAEHGWGNAIHRAIVKDDWRSVFPDEVMSLFKPSEGNIPDSWLDMVEKYKYKITYRTYHEQATVEHRGELEKAITKDLFELVKPCKAIEIPLGQVCIDRYKSWYR